MIRNIIHATIITLIAGAVVLFGFSAQTQFGGGGGTINQLDQMTATSSPYTAVTPRTYGKSIYTPGAIIANYFTATSTNATSTIEDNFVVRGNSLFGEGDNISPFYGVRIVGTTTVSVAAPSDTASFGINTIMNMAAAVKRGAAFNGKTTIKGSSVLPFISGMLFEVRQEGTGVWGANPGVWQDEPTVIASRWTSSSGSASMGNWVNNITAGTPVFSGGDPSGTYNQFAANDCCGDVPTVNGLYVDTMTGTTMGSGIFINPASHFGIVLDGNGAGSDIAFGGSQQANIMYSTNLVFNSRRSGTGNFEFQNGNMGIGTSSPYAKLTVFGSGTDGNRLVTFANSASTTLFSLLENGTTYMQGNLGIGTTSPLAKLSIQGVSGSGTRLFQVASSSNAYPYFTIEANGHQKLSGVTPTVSTGAADCGTGPTIVGNDTVGRVTVGTSASGTCTVTFYQAFTNPPICVVNLDDTGANVNAKNITTTQVQLMRQGGGSFGAGDLISYHCYDYQ